MIFSRFDLIEEVLGDSKQLRRTGLAVDASLASLQKLEASVADVQVLAAFVQHHRLQLLADQAQLRLEHVRERLALQLEVGVLDRLGPV